MPARIKNYVLVAKPGIVVGNLISAAAGFLLASKGRLDGVTLSAATLLGVSLVVAAGGVFNNCVDRNLDPKNGPDPPPRPGVGAHLTSERRLLRHAFGPGGPGPALGGNQPAGS